jgi:hypothetical protein
VSTNSGTIVQSYSTAAASVYNGYAGALVGRNTASGIIVSHTPQERKRVITISAGLPVQGKEQFARKVIGTKKIRAYQRVPVSRQASTRPQEMA